MRVRARASFEVLIINGWRQFPEMGPHAQLLPRKIAKNTERREEGGGSVCIFVLVFLGMRPYSSGLTPRSFSLRHWKK